ncbi:hypothetical protein [Flavobacterium sp. AG291]|uniref:hypothetical protein n=1 Tax=Flavobacterium sp. AG291 TaxID=2184000 RepID=UPI000E0C1CE9|nr:hypothetical protein [Flavobacterium sp. AG291]RDI14582.1 hypothetical protein DEU42_102279 [Flavobacterium sp. AG291]
MSIEQFVDKIENFDKITISAKIDYFIYYHTIIKGINGVKSKDIEGYYDALRMPKYSNIAQYLAINSKKSKNKLPKYVLQQGLYYLERIRKNEIDIEVNAPKIITPSSDLFPLELVENTRGYITKVASQAIICYDLQQYDASLVMIRKLLETLVIEIFEKYNVSDEIKDSDGNFYMLSALIDALLSHKNWNLGRTTKQYFPHIKKLADTSAHNRRFVAKKPDIDKYKSELRMIIEELVHLADFK